MNTIWKPIPCFELRYEVSNDGQVRSLDATVACGNKALRSVKGRLLKPGLTVGYPCVVLGKGNTRMVHTLVAAAFIGPRPAGNDVLHIDGSRTNNHISNLKYGSRSENNRDIFRHGKRKLSVAEVNGARDALAKGVTGAAVAALLGVSQSQVSNIKHGRQYA
jgi:hypothetical protein